MLWIITKKRHKEETRRRDTANRPEQEKQKRDIKKRHREETRTRDTKKRHKVGRGDPLNTPQVAPPEGRKKSTFLRKYWPRFCSPKRHRPGEKRGHFSEANRSIFFGKNGRFREAGFSLAFWTKNCLGGGPHTQNKAFGSPGDPLCEAKSCLAKKSSFS